MKTTRDFGVSERWLFIVVAGVVVALTSPFTPIVAGAIELALFDTHFAFEWLRTTGVEETIADFYRQLGWPI